MATIGHCALSRERVRPDEHPIAHRNRLAACNDVFLAASAPAARVPGSLSDCNAPDRSTEVQMTESTKRVRVTRAGTGSCGVARGCRRRVRRDVRDTCGVGYWLARPTLAAEISRAEAVLALSMFDHGRSAPQGAGSAVLVAMDLHGATAGNSFCSRFSATWATLTLVACATSRASWRAADVPGVGSNRTTFRFSGMERSRCTRRPTRRV